MSQIETLTPPQAGAQQGQPDVFHTTCCEDDDLALCGLDVSDLPFTDGEDEQNCIVCEDLYLNHPSDCPRFGVCPVWAGIIS